MMHEFSILLSQSDAYKAGEAIGKVIGVILLIAIPALFILSIIRLILTKKKSWLAGLIISSFCLLGLVGAVIYQAAKVIQSKATEKQIVKTDDGILQLNVPGSWKSKSDLSDVDTLSYCNLFQEQYCIVITEAKEDFEDGFSLKDYSEACILNTHEAASKHEDGEWVDYEVSGCATREIEVKAVIDGVKINYLLGYYESKNHFHQIMMWTLSSKWEKTKPVFKEVLESVKPLNG